MQKRLDALASAVNAVRGSFRIWGQNTGADGVDPTDPKSALWELLNGPAWKLLPQKELQLMAPALRATYAYAFGIEVRELTFLSLAAQPVAAQLPVFLSDDSVQNIISRLAYAVATEAQNDRLADLLVSEKDKPITQEVFDVVRFDAGVEFLMTEALGPIAAGAAKTVAVAMREHARRMQSDPQSAGAIRDLLASFQYTLPFMRHQTKRGTLVLLCD